MAAKQGVVSAGGGRRGESGAPVRGAALPPRRSAEGTPGGDRDTAAGKQLSRAPGHGQPHAPAARERGREEKFQTLRPSRGVRDLSVRTLRSSALLWLFRVRKPSQTQRQRRDLAGEAAWAAAVWFPTKRFVSSRSERITKHNREIRSFAVPWAAQTESLPMAPGTAPGVAATVRGQFSRRLIGKTRKGAGTAITGTGWERDGLKQTPKRAGLWL